MNPRWIVCVGVLATAAPAALAQLSYVDRSAGLQTPQMEAGDTELEFGDVDRDGHVDSAPFTRPCFGLASRNECGGCADAGGVVAVGSAATPAKGRQRKRSSERRVTPFTRLRLPS